MQASVWIADAVSCCEHGSDDGGGEDNFGARSVAGSCRSSTRVPVHICSLVCKLCGQKSEPPSPLKSAFKACKFGVYGGNGC